ncbi:cytochrome c [Ruegeria sp. Ofav3-42]|uniref:cytochrome c n=1 Tax=Ruegeria sp. Ofav3-42 TaxID=2917759 RepID=UPI001EF44AE1|nr:cytochrome c [Ruegeria sp. Ofav3-42]MCG7522810.1 cytochrome c [Ruegeria sp. Ofav3-42]
MARIFKVMIQAVVCAVILIIPFFWLWAVPSVENHPIATDAETIAKGKYLTAAGDCTSCHTTEDGAAFAGGLKLDTPFGGIYSANITPSEKGIKGMTSAEFYQVLAYGSYKTFRPLYPAMPYPSYHLVTRSDSDAMFAYLMTQTPVDQSVPKNELSFPFNIRQLVLFWNVLFARRGPYEPDGSRDEVWNRGAYLVEGLGHCGACHTPHNSFGAAEHDRALAGTPLAGYEAPDIQPEALKRRGWNAEYLTEYFKTGRGPKGTAFKEMYLVVKNSLSLLTDEDRAAIATYLLDLPSAPTADGNVVLAASDGDTDEPYPEGRTLFLNNCSMCHGPRGKGVKDGAPPLAGNSTVAQVGGRNMIYAIVYGFPEPRSVPNSSPMPAFKDRLTPTQIVELANFLRHTFASETPDLPKITEADIEAILK